MNESIFGCFISQKIAKIRWKPEQNADPEYFVTGSHDDEENFINLWHFPLEDENNDDNLPFLKSKIPVNGDVTALQFLNHTTLISANSHGSVSLLNCSEKELLVNSSWDELHNGMCSDVANFDEDVVTVGSDGRLTLLDIKQEKPLRVIDNADSSLLLCVSFLKHYEIVTGNIRGLLKIWDHRSPADIPSVVVTTSGEGNAITCVINHPSQKHLMLAGSEDGGVMVWDLRKSTSPLHVLNAHSSPVMEMMFHPDRPGHLFTCSMGGDLWQWNPAKNIREQGGDESAWLNGDAASRKMEISSLMTPISKPINSFDVNRFSLVCGCDNEAIYLIKKLIL